MTSTRHGLKPAVPTTAVCASRIMLALLSATMLFIEAPFAHADDSPSPCAALKRIVHAAPNGFAALTPDDGRGMAQPYGDDAQCNGGHDSYQCQWTPRNGGSSADALQGVAADIASCLPDATHDVNSPARQHFYLGPRGSRTEITATTAGASKLRLTVSGK